MVKKGYGVSIALFNIPVQAIAAPNIKRNIIKTESEQIMTCAHGMKIIVRNKTAFNYRSILT